MKNHFKLALAILMVLSVLLTGLVACTPDVDDSTETAPKNETTETEAIETTETEAPESGESDAPDESETKAPESSETEAPASSETEAPASSETEAPASTEAPSSSETEAPATSESTSEENTENKPEVSLSWVPTYSLDKKYDGKPVDAPATNNYYLSGSTEAATVAWYEGDVKLDAAPVNAGTYKVVLTVEDKSIEKDFAITQIHLKDISLTKVYDGTQVVNINLTEQHGVVAGESLVLIGMTNTADVGASLVTAVIQHANGKQASNYVYSVEDIEFAVVPMKITFDSSKVIEKTYDGTARVTIKITEGFIMKDDSCTVSFIAKSSHNLNGNGIKNAGNYDYIIATDVVDDNPNVDVEFVGELNLHIARKEIKLLRTADAEYGFVATTIQMTASQFAKGYGYILPEAGACAGDVVRFNFVGDSYESITIGNFTNIILFAKEENIPEKLGERYGLAIELDKNSDAVNYELVMTNADGNYADGTDTLNVGSYYGMVGSMTVYADDSTVEFLPGTWSGQNWMDTTTLAVSIDMTDKTKVEQNIAVVSDGKEHRAAFAVELKANTTYKVTVISTDGNKFDPNQLVNFLYSGEGIFTSWGEKLAYDDATNTFKTLEFYDGSYFIGTKALNGWKLVIEEVVE